KSGHKLSTRNADPDPTPSVPPRMVVKSPSHDDSPPAVPFDSNLFLEHMRCPHAEPIAKYLRLFLKEFTKRTTHPPKTTGVAEQVKVVNNFLDIQLNLVDVPPKESTATSNHLTNHVHQRTKNNKNINININKKNSRSALRPPGPAHPPGCSSA
ncbi:hypothetical protein PTTG_10746, partial [Puccinia triticina 1-1 BBBD Race 1]|uniref:Uncharacterized protein n=1 Tax=Puccinia triticina (isolate 1-1 / race 1 (BBBD)) TaxID=630390 RepID=A0A0C4FBZ5_PUCT1